MRANLFWLNDDQWEKIKPLLPTKQPVATTIDAKAGAVVVCVA
jgi:hypothetical protein